jgi:hypothetical protein
MQTCRCGCDEPIKRGRKFVNKEHQLEWMLSGGAKEMNELQSLEAKARGGIVAGHQAAANGRLHDAAIRGGARAREIAERFRERRAQEESHPSQST